MPKDDWGSRLGSLIDEIFGVAESVKDKVYTEMEKVIHLRGDNADYYPAYTYPPMNVYLDAEKNLVLELALAGFRKEDLSLKFQGDFLIFSASWSRPEVPSGVTWLKHRLKARSVPEQKYYVPQERFDQGSTEALFQDGLLTIKIPSRVSAKMAKEQVVEIR